MNIRRYGALLAGGLVFLLAGCRPSAPPPIPSDLDTRLEELAEAFFANGDFSGIVAISRDGELLGTSTVGSPDSDPANSHDLHTSFHIASISKTFTAVAIRSLAERDALSLDAPLSSLLPGFPEGERLTIRHLLDHRSGIPDYWSLPDVREVMARKLAVGEIVDWLGSHSLEFEPGSDFSYSNSGYTVLAAVIEAASGQPYHDYLAARVYPAAALTETGAFRNDTDTVEFSPAYGPGRIEPSPTYDPSILVGAGSLRSTAGDLLSWCEAFNADFLNPGTATFVHGWGVRSENGRRRVEQTGRNPGFSSHLRAYPDSRTCVVVLSNIESDSVAALGAGASSIVFGEPVTPPARRTVIPVPEDKLVDYVGRFEISEGREL